MIEYDAAPLSPDAVPRLEDDDAARAQAAARAGDLPPNAAQFASIPGRFQTGADPVRNLKFGRITVHEYQGGTAGELLLRGYPELHTTDLVVTYYGIIDVRFAPGAADTNNAITNPTTMGRSLSDRIHPDPRGCVHEIQFSGGTLTVLCADVAGSWIPRNSRG